MEKATFSLPWSRENIEGAALQENYFFLVGTDDQNDDDILCYAAFYYVLDEAEIPLVCVREDMRGRGLGRELMNALVVSAKALNVYRMYLEVRVSNAPARKLYSVTGFKEVGVRKGFYQFPREDAVVMELTID